MLSFTKNKVLLLFFLLFQINIFAQNIVIDENTKDINILKYSQLYIDKDSKKSISDIVNLSKDFMNIHKHHVNYGYIFKDTIWVKFTIINNSEKDIEKELVYDNPNTDIVNLHWIEDEKLYLDENGIYNRYFFNNKLFFAFKIKLKPTEFKTYYLELKPKSHSLHFTLSIQDIENYYNNEFIHQIILTLFFSALLVIIIYNAIFFIMSRHTIYLYYVLFLISIFVHHLSLTGTIAYLLPQNIELIRGQSYLAVYYICIVFITILTFVSNFLHIRKNSKIDLLFKLYILITISIMVLNSEENYLLHLSVYLGLLIALSIEAVGLYMFVTSNSKHTKYFFMVWSITIFGMIGTILYYAGILSSPIAYLFEITLIIEALLFSTILASQINDLENEKLLLSMKIMKQEKHELEQDKIIQAQAKLASIGEMMRHITHQWRQPLSEINSVAMKLETDFMKNRLDTKSLNTNLEQIENLTEYMSQTIEDFNSYFKEDKKREYFTLEAAITRALNLLDCSIKNNEITINVQTEDSTEINSYFSEFTQVLIAIINNSIDAFEDQNINNKIIIIRTTKEDEKHIIIIEDNANGIKNEHLPKVFEQYFTTKSNSKGAGIGLYMSKMIVEDSMKGSINVTNTKSGARFTIIL